MGILIKHVKVAVFVEHILLVLIYVFPNFTLVAVLLVKNFLSLDSPLCKSILFVFLQLSEFEVFFLLLVAVYLSL